MFTQNERDIIVSKLMMILEERKAGKADARRELAETLTDVTREYLKGRYDGGNAQKEFKTGIVRLQDVITDEDIGRQ